MTLAQWLKSHLGTAIDIDHSYGPQCVDAVNAWLAASLSSDRAVSATAAGIADERWRGHAWTYNTLHNFPSPGDVVVWHPQVHSVGIGQAGHTAICVLADQYALVTADQNWMLRRYLAIYAHSYDGLAGWQHRR